MKTMLTALMAALLLALTATAAPAAGDELRTPRADPAGVRAAAEELLAAIPPQLQARGDVAEAAAALRKAVNDTSSRTDPVKYTRGVIERMNRLGDLVAEDPVLREELGIRTEEALGTTLCHPSAIADGVDYCDSDQWLSTRSTNFVNIRGEVVYRGSTQIPHGRQVTASFVASHDRTSVAITFVAEAYVLDDLAGADRRMFLQALVDSEPVNPADVVFAVGEHRGVRSFVFTTVVDAGIHTVEMRWKVDERATAYLKDATLLVRMGSGQASNLGTLVVKTPPSGANVDTMSNAWSGVPSMGAYVYVTSSGELTATFSAESVVSNGKRIVLRALVDGVAMRPSDVIFAKGGQIQSRSMTFAESRLSKGYHYVEFQWMTEAGGTATFGDRSMVLASFPNDAAKPTHPFIVAPSGENIYTDAGGLEPMAAMNTTVWVPADGNGEVAVQLSAEMGTTAGGTAYMTLAVDGEIQLDQIVLVTDGTPGAQVKSWVFEAKKLTPGLHHLEIWFGDDGVGEAYVGDRSLAVISEVGFIPDLAEAPQFGAGHVNWEGDLIAGIEPLVGTRKVLAVLIDPQKCGDPGSIVVGPPLPIEEDCQTQDSVPKGKVEAAIWGTGGDGDGLVAFEPNNIVSYFAAQSNGRFTIEKAGPGTAGYYNGTFGPGMYFNHPGTCEYGFDNGGDMLIADAVWQSDADVDFSDFDVDGDGKLNPEELTIVVVIPRPDGDGSALATLHSSNCDGNAAPMELDGVQLPHFVAKWNTSLDDDLEILQFTTGAHELLHVMRFLDDIYMNGTDWATEANQFSLMGSNRSTTTHLDPWTKLALGWVTPIRVHESSTVTVTNVAESNEVYVIPRYHYGGAGEEFVILENRQADQGYPNFDDGLGESGIAVWHVINDLDGITTSPIGVPEALWDDLNVDDDRPGSTGQMGRKGLRLIRPFDDIVDGTAVFNGGTKNSLWTANDYTLENGDCFLVVPTGDPFHNKLAWGDCTASGISIDVLDWAQEAMDVQVTFH
jgi:M6 family metalloprotease-like protein